jgi:hypothetical protein
MTRAALFERVACERVRTRLSAALGVIATFSCALSATQTASHVVLTADAVTRLEVGKPIEREIAGGRSHTYQLSLPEDQYARVGFEHRGVDLVVRLLGADGTVHVETESHGRDGREVLEFTAEGVAPY